MIHDGEVLISVRDLGKKFCRSLRRSMVYGIADLGRGMFGRKPDTTTLRPDEFWAVEGVDFELRRGEVLGLIGANGSGKSTLLRLLAGIFPPDRGEIVIRGRVGALIALGAGFHPHMTGLENIYLNGTILGMTRSEIDQRLEAIIDFAEIGDFVQAPVSTYSSGMRVRLGFAVAAHLEPDILLIDEVLAVGDIGFRTKCLNAIERMTRNAAVIFVSHQMPQVTRICTDIIVMNHGRVDYQGRDCLQGVEHYFSLQGDCRKRISGTGQVAIGQVILQSDSGGADDSNPVVGSGEGLTVLFDCATSVWISRPVLHIAFFSVDERPVAQCDSDLSGFFPDLPVSDWFRARVRIPVIPFNPGRYYVSIIVMDEKRHEIFAHHHAVASFFVTGSFLSYTPVHLAGMWEEAVRD